MSTMYLEAWIVSKYHVSSIQQLSRVCVHGELLDDDAEAVIVGDVWQVAVVAGPSPQRRRRPQARIELLRRRAELGTNRHLEGLLLSWLQVKNAFNWLL
jgi:hypothetical protein